MAAIFGQLVIGPPGSGKTTYCQTMGHFLKSIGRKVSIINIDPANDSLIYEAAADVSELVTVDDVMTNLHLGPNGGLMFCMEFLEKNVDWLLEHVCRLRDSYILFDCPGQVELYTHHNSMKNITEKLEKYGVHLCAVHLVDCHYCNDPGKFISALLLSLSAMLQLALPHINVLSKIDLLSKYSSKLHFGLDFYTDVLDLKYLLDCLDEDPFTKKYKKLNAAIVSLVEDFSLVSFIPMNIGDRQSILKVKNAVDKANGYIFGAGEQRNVQALLACAVGADYETGEDMDRFTEGAAGDDEDDDDLMMRGVWA
ncbi:GPN-loop GTPase 2 [Schistocerca cancellata]|uniref:GPN-loop GTPase 2 n=1 Tax=Schistocerca cancellata TaxID=274614 RepID=UPI0021186F64|nr:GPN-loop GTPase 2 [Schistocerca cancellata]